MKITAVRSQKDGREHGHRIHSISLLITQTSMTEVLADTSRDLSQYQQMLPPLNTLSPLVWISSVRLTGSIKDTWADSKRKKNKAHLRVEFLNFLISIGYMKKNVCNS